MDGDHHAQRHQTEGVGQAERERHGTGHGRVRDRGGGPGDQIVASGQQEEGQAKLKVRGGQENQEGVDLGPVQLGGSRAELGADDASPHGEDGQARREEGQDEGEATPMDGRQHGAGKGIHRHQEHCPRRDFGQVVGQLEIQAERRGELAEGDIERVHEDGVVRFAGQVIVDQPGPTRGPFAHRRRVLGIVVGGPDADEDAVGESLGVGEKEGQLDQDQGGDGGDRDPAPFGADAIPHAGPGRLPPTQPGHEGRLVS